MTARGPGYVGARPRAVGFLELASGSGYAETGTAFRVTAGAELAQLLAEVPAIAERLYLTDAPRVGWGAWARAGTLPEGWSHAPRGHHLPRDSALAPALRYARPDGRVLELRSAGEWYGPGAYAAGPGACREAWAMLGYLLSASRHGGMLLASPAATGRDLLARTLPPGKTFPVLDAETRELIASTAAQGRVELFPPRRPTLPGLCELDARVAYGACLRELGSGIVAHDQAPDLPLDSRGKLTARCRLKVRVTVPPGWDHVGLLAAPERPYRYPRAAGETFTTWADGVEVALALEHGWRVEVLERLLFEQGRPLDGWRDALLALDQAAQAADVDAVTRELAGRAVRSMLVATIGSFHQTSYRVTRTTTDAAAVPAGVAFAADDAGGFVWEERRELAGAVMRWSHPEWSAQIWARARVRLLKAPGGAGVLSVPMHEVVALRTDAVYLTRRPGWPDTGRWGDYRLKGALGATRRRWPANAASLLKLRDAGRANLEAIAGASRG